MAGNDDDEYLRLQRFDLMKICATDPSLRTLLTAVDVFTAEFRDRPHPLATTTIRTLRAITRMWLAEAALEDDHTHDFDQALRLLERAANMANAVPINSIEGIVLTDLPSVPEGRRHAPQMRQLHEFIAGVMARPAALDDAEEVLEQARLLGLGPPRRRYAGSALTLARDGDRELDVLPVDEVDQPNTDPFYARLTKALTFRPGKGNARRRAIDEVLRLALRAVGLTWQQTNSWLRSIERTTPKRAKREIGKPRRRRK